jgi:hypothetical protein
LRARSDAASKDLGQVIADSAAVQSSLHQQLQLQAWTRSTVLQRNLDWTRHGGRFYGGVEASLLIATAYQQAMAMQDPRDVPN